MGEGPSILVRCDGSPEIGFGHVVRCLALADELRGVHGCRVVFAMRKGPLGFDMVRQGGYPVVEPGGPHRSFDYPRWMTEALGAIDARVLILDVRDDLRREDVELLKVPGRIVAVLDDLSDRRLAADLAFYPPIPQLRRAGWEGFGGKVHAGWDMVLLRPEFSRCRRDRREGTPTILVTMGGSDPAGLTLNALNALDRLSNDFRVLVVLGPGFLHEETLSALLPGMRHRSEVMRDVRNMADIMSRADLAVASFGVTAYELAAAGVPAIYLCLTQDHAESATALVREGVAVSLGTYEGASAEALAEAASHLMNDSAAREGMSKRASGLVDGGGAERIAREIVEAIGKAA